jgi:hypothetical protein
MEIVRIILKLFGIIDLLKWACYYRPDFNIRP